MNTTTANLTVGQTFTPTEGKFEGRTFTVSSIGTQGVVLCATEASTGKKAFMRRNDTSVTVA